MDAHRKYPIIISASYFTLASIYILVSSQLATLVSSDVYELQSFEIFKGLGFCIVSALLLFVLCRILFGRIEKNAQEVVRGRQALLQSERKAMAGILAGSVAHDCNNILSILKLAVDSMELEMSLGSSNKQNLERMHRALDQLHHLVQQLQQVGSSGVQIENASLQTVPIRQLVQQSFELVQWHPNVKVCTVTFASSVPESETVELYPTVIHQALLNLLINAGEAASSSKDKRIHVQAYIDQDLVHVMVHDSGPGVPPHMRERIQQNGYSSKGPGRGLGLPSVIAAMVQHNGHIKITDSALGGACFELIWPVHIQRHEAPRLAFNH